MIDLSGKNVLVTGGNGFVGKHVVEILNGRKASVITPDSNELDLSGDYEDNNIRNFLIENGVDYVIHLAALSGGIVFNRTNRPKIYRENLLMGINLLDACVAAEIKKSVMVITSCSFVDGPSELHETMLHAGKPNKTVEAFAYAKRGVEIYSRLLSEEGKTLSVVAAGTNLFGPGNYLETDRLKMVEALIIKFIKAKRNNDESVTVLGSGMPRRDLLYVGDFSELLVRTLEKYDDFTDPINLGSGTDYSVAEIAEMIKKLVGYNGQIVFDKSSPDGQMRKLLSTAKMQRELGFFQKTPLSMGLARTVSYYENNL